MENNQTTIELETVPPKPDIDTSMLPDDDAQNPVGGFRYQTV